MVGCASSDNLPILDPGAYFYVSQRPNEPRRHDTKRPIWYGLSERLLQNRASRHTLSTASSLDPKCVSDVPERAIPEQLTSVVRMTFISAVCAITAKIAVFQTCCSQGQVKYTGALPKSPKRVLMCWPATASACHQSKEEAETLGTPLPCDTCFLFVRCRRP
jgi:hypothetical protein